MMCFLSKSVLLQAILLSNYHATAFVPCKVRSNLGFSALLAEEKTFFADVAEETNAVKSVVTADDNSSVVVGKEATETTDTTSKVVPAMEELSLDPTLGSSDETMVGLKTLADALNPIVGFYDPLQLSEASFWGLPNSDTVGFLRHAEIKHARVAMAAFVGYIVQSNWHWPWDMSLDGSPFPSIDLSPEAQWDAIPLNAKLQIITVIGFLEFWDELGGNIAESPALGMQKQELLPHYTKGRMPGQYPSFQYFRETVHWVPDLYDPFNNIRTNKKFTEEKREKGRMAEINNGRLAMLAIIAFLAADKIPGSVPLLNNIAQPYDGNTMIPFSNDFTFGFGATEVVQSVTSDSVDKLIDLIAQPIETIPEPIQVTIPEPEPLKAIIPEPIQAPSPDSFVPQLLNN